MIIFPGSSVSNSVIFEGSEATNVTAYFGSTAILSCKIRNNLEDNPVLDLFYHRSDNKLILIKKCLGIMDSVKRLAYFEYRS